VDAETGALLVECFGFIEADVRQSVKVSSNAPGAPRRRAPAKRTSA
jgi:hypothetical protein